MRVPWPQGVTFSSALRKGEEGWMGHLPLVWTSELTLEKLEEHRSERTLHSCDFNPEFMNEGPIEEF